MNEINYNINSPVAKPIDEATPNVPPPSQTADGDEYLCGHAGNAHPYANAGRDQDRNRSDEYQGASPFSRYVS